MYPQVGADCVVLLWRAQCDETRQIDNINRGWQKP